MDTVAVFVIAVVVLFALFFCGDESSCWVVVVVLLVFLDDVARCAVLIMKVKGLIMNAHGS